MTIPNVTVTELDGALGILPQSSGLLAAFAGVANAGPLNTPAAFARTRDVVSTFGGGPTVEEACYEIERYGKPIVFVRTGATTVSTLSAVTFVGTGTSVVTATGTSDDDYEIAMKVIAGGTRGVAGITYQLSYDGGRTYGAVTALGTASTIAVPASGAVVINLAAGTLVAGDLATFRANAPQWNAAEITTALTALQVTQQPWEFVRIVGAVDASLFSTISAGITAMHNAGKHKWALVNTRMPNLAESDATYTAAMVTAFASSADSSIAVFSGAAKIESSISRRRYRRPVALAIAGRAAALSEEVDFAQVDLGPLPGVAILDTNGNPDEHDEANSPTLDASRFGSLRSLEGYPGVYVTNPRLMCTTGSDFVFIQYRRTMNIARTVLEAYFKKRLSKAVRVNRTTGFILESEARDIESGAKSALATALLAKPKASAVDFVLSRTDNILSTFTLTGQARIIPLGYPKFINIDVGFNNPALRTSGV
jgi:hypothetical protein